MTQPVFYYDLGNPACYVVAEQIGAALPEPAEWEPVHLGAGEAMEREAIERGAAEAGLQPVRWPAVWPPETRTAMLAATYAKQIGRTVAFSLAAYPDKSWGTAESAAPPSFEAGGSAVTVNVPQTVVSVAPGNTGTVTLDAQRMVNDAGGYTVTGETGDAYCTWPMLSPGMATAGRFSMMYLGD